MLDLGLIDGIDTACGLVQNQDGGILEHRPGDGQPLPLPPRKSHATLTDHGIQPEGTLRHEIGGPGHLQCMADVFFAGRRPGHQQIVADRVMEKEGVLGHHRDAGAEFGQRHIPDIVAIDEDPPTARVKESQQQ